MAPPRVRLGYLRYFAGHHLPLTAKGLRVCIYACRNRYTLHGCAYGRLLGRLPGHSLALALPGWHRQTGAGDGRRCHLCIGLSAKKSRSEMVAVAVSHFFALHPDLKPGFEMFLT